MFLFIFKYGDPTECEVSGKEDHKALRVLDCCTILTPDVTILHPSPISTAKLKSQGALTMDFTAGVTLSSTAHICSLSFSLPLFPPILFHSLSLLFPDAMHSVVTTFSLSFSISLPFSLPCHSLSLTPSLSALLQGCGGKIQRRADRLIFGASGQWALGETATGSFAIV